MSNFLRVCRRPSALKGDVAVARLRGRTRVAGGADPSGVSMFRTHETRPGPGALCTPGTAVPARPRMHPVTAACRLSTAGPCHPGTTARPGMFFSRGISKGSLAFAPPGHSLACDPQTERGPLGSAPGLHTPLSSVDPAAHAGAGTGLRHWPGVTSPPSTTSLDEPTH
jgi:hypothetical protein